MSGVEIIDLSEVSDVPARQPFVTLILRALVIVPTISISSIVAAAATQFPLVGQTVANQVGALIALLVISFLLLVCLVAIPSLLLFRLEGTDMKLRMGGVGLAILALGLAYVGLVCSIYGMSVWTWTSITRFLTCGLVGGFGLEMFPLASSTFARAQRTMLRKADEFLKADGAPIIYLRSFSEDDRVTAEEQTRDYDTGNIECLDFYTYQRQRKFEEILCEGLGSVAPVVAIERPGDQDQLAPIGAARLSVRDKDWQSEVERLVRSCCFTVLVMGDSDGLLWEFAHAVETVSESHLLLIVPARPEWREVWRSFVNHCVSRNLPPKLPDAASLDFFLEPIAVAFRANWKPVLFTGLRIPLHYRRIAQWMTRENRESDANK